jgi:hypothetical protein
MLKLGSRRVTHAPSLSDSTPLIDGGAPLKGAAQKLKEIL